ncbi:MAG: thermonuclease family protein [Alphaproteobacteria bacterium]
MTTKQILALFIALTTLFSLSPILARAEITNMTPQPQAQGQEQSAQRAIFDALRKTGSGRVTTIIDPQTLQLQDGRIIRLAGLNFPDYIPQDENTEENGKYTALAMDILRDMLIGKDVDLYQTSKKDWGRMNRMGHHIAHLKRQEGGLWVQGTLLSLGLAQVRTSQRNPEMAVQMLAREAQARADGLGLWAEETYRILTPDEAAGATGHFVLVEGRVESAAIKKNRIYLNFGQNWRDDFTVSIPPGSKRLFSKQGIDPLAFNGKTLRVRGRVEMYNGPYIEINHPEAIEVIESAETDEAGE